LGEAKERIMNNSLKQIEEQALNLSPEERAKLAEFMLESLNEPLADIEAVWSQEIELRVAADLPLYAAEDVFAEAKLTGK
jgi:hypothetical protein